MVRCLIKYFLIFLFPLVTIMVVCIMYWVGPYLLTHTGWPKNRPLSSIIIKSY